VAGSRAFQSGVWLRSGHRLAVVLRTQLGPRSLGRADHALWAIRRWSSASAGLAVQPLVMADPWAATAALQRPSGPALHRQPLQQRAALACQCGPSPAACSRHWARARCRALGPVAHWRPRWLQGGAAVHACGHPIQPRHERPQQRGLDTGCYLHHGATTWHAAALRGRREQGFVMGGVGEPWPPRPWSWPARSVDRRFEVRFVFAGITQRLTAVTTVKLACTTLEAMAAR